MSNLLTPSYTTSIQHHDNNRYDNVYCNEDTRVIVDNYINANVVNDYIITQAPLTHTVVDFWDMIDTYHVKQIVMLTPLEENNKEKCVLYWPDQTTLYGHVLVKFVKSTMLNDHVMVRTFLVNDKKVKQYQLLSWLDFGLPPMAPFCDLIKLIEHKTCSTLAPMQMHCCIHCSAGIGRSGVFAVVHHLYHNVINSDIKTINIVDTILDMRKQRSGLVQTKEQLKFCYDALHYLLQ